MITATLGGFQILRRLPRLAPAIVGRIDGRRSLAAIRRDLQEANPAVTEERFQQEFRETYAVLRGLNLLLLRRP